MHISKIVLIILTTPAFVVPWFSSLTNSVADIKSKIYYMWVPCEVNSNHRTQIEDQLSKKVKGQYIAVSHAKWAIESHLNENNPKHALSIVFAGTTGTGKNFISSIISESILHNKGHIHLYAGRNAFPDESKLEEYRNQLRRDITAAVKQCERSIFIFDEIDKMPENLLDAVKPYLDFHPHINHVDYRKSIFIFLTNIGGLELNTQYRILREQGMIRENMLYAHFEHILRRALFNEAGLMKNSQVISDHLISFYIPFLPLERSHVKECILQEMSDNGQYGGEEIVSRIIENIDFSENGISRSGCKRVSNFVAMEMVRRKYEL